MSMDQLTGVVMQLQQTVLAQAERIHQLEDRVRRLEDTRKPMASTATLTPATQEVASLEEHREQERKELLAALKRTGWNRLEAARLLGMPRRTLYRRMAEYGIQEGDTRVGVAKREKARAKRKAR